MYLSMPELCHFVSDILVHFIPFPLPGSKRCDFRFAADTKSSPMRLNDCRSLIGEESSMVLEWWLLLLFFFVVVFVVAVAVVFVVIFVVVVYFLLLLFLSVLGVSLRVIASVVR